MRLGKNVNKLVPRLHEAKLHYSLKKMTGDRMAVNVDMSSPSMKTVIMEI